MAYDFLWRAHAILMGTSFLSMLSGIVISLAWKKRKWRFKTHRFLGVFAGASGLAALALAFIMVGSYGGYHFTSAHAVVGLIAAILLLLVPAAGLSIAKVKNKKRLKLIHRAAGFLLAALMLSAIFLGLEFAGII